MYRGGHTPPSQKARAIAFPAFFAIVASDRPAHKDVLMTLQVLHPPLLAPTSEADDRLDYARQIIRAEAAALDLVAQRLDGAFLQAVELIQSCPGRLAITGTGKSADVGQKMAGGGDYTGKGGHGLYASPPAPEALAQV